MKDYKNLELSSKSLVIIKKKNTYTYSLKKLILKNLKKDEVIIKVEFNSFNYKDILIGKGNPGLVRSYPHVPGIDCTGKIYYSNSKKFKFGDKVMVIARPVGINSFGTMSNYFVVSSKFVEKIPSNINIKLPVVFGTAGFTAMIAINELKNLKINKKYPILITGASGGVGLFSTFILNKLGYKITAATTNIKKNKKKLKLVGANEIINYEEFDKAINLPLLKKKYGAIIDNLGGSILANSIKTLHLNGALISIGNIRSNHSIINILPFILRQVRIVGINAESANLAIRKKIWKNIFRYNNDKNLINLYTEYKFSLSSKIFKKLLKNNYSGRVIFKI